MKKSTNFLVRFGFSAIAALTFVLTPIHVQAAKGADLLAEAMDSSDINNGDVSCEKLVAAVNKAVKAHPKDAAEIVGAAELKTKSRKCQTAILENAILALGDYRKYNKNLIPSMVATAIKNSCGGKDTGYDKDGYSKDGNANDGCDCAAELTKVAILALGNSPEEGLVVAIVDAAVGSVNGKCVEQIVSSATEAAPTYASAIADSGARAGSNQGGDNFTVFNPTGNMTGPGAFFSPSAPSGGLVSATTPVN